MDIKVFSLKDGHFRVFKLTNVSETILNSKVMRINVKTSERMVDSTADGMKKEENELATDFQNSLQGVLGLMAKAENLQKENEELNNHNLLLQQKQDKQENDSFYKAVNINTILKYAQDPGICDSIDMKAIQRMLLILCDDQDKETKEKIKTMKLGGNIVIEYVENLNPSVTKVETNHYHNK